MDSNMLGVVIAISLGTFSIVGVMISLFLWNRSESNSDRRYHVDTIDELRSEVAKIYARLGQLSRKK